MRRNDEVRENVVMIALFAAIFTVIAMSLMIGFIYGIYLVFIKKRRRASDGNVAGPGARTSDGDVAGSNVRTSDGDVAGPRMTAAGRASASSSEGSASAAGGAGRREQPDPECIVVVTRQGQCFHTDYLCPGLVGTTRINKRACRYCVGEEVRSSINLDAAASAYQHRRNADPNT